MGNEQALQIFRYQDNEVRHVLKDGQSWWVASDVCKILGLGNVSMAVNGNAKTGDAGLDEDEKVLVNESGLYHLIFKSRKAEAQHFRRWVTGEVLPSIRKTGSYSLQPEPTPTLSDALRQRAFLNEGRVPAALFSTQCELTRELHYLEGFLNTTLDTGAYRENSVGQCFSPYARLVIPIPDSERRKYPHQLPNGRRVAAWAYPIGYLPDFRRWLYEVYFPVKYPVYRRYRARRSGAAQALQGGVTRKLIAQRHVEQLPLF